MLLVLFSSDAVSDSNGYLRDITEQLKRFDEDNKTIVFSESDAQVLYLVIDTFFAEDFSMEALEA